MVRNFMPIAGRITFGGLTFVCTLLVSTLVAIADDDPTQNAYNAFLTALSALTASSSSAIQNERNAGRLDAIKQALTAQVISGLTGQPFSPPAGWSTGGPSKLSDLDESHLLCDFRSDDITIVPDGKLSGRDPGASITVDQISTVAAQNYLNSVLTQLKGITPPNATDIPSALKQLFTSYQIKAPIAGVLPSGTQIQDAREAAKKGCGADLSEYEVAYYGYKIQLGPVAAAAAPTSGLPALSFLGPWGTAFDTITSILTPVLVGFSNLVVTYDEKIAIQNFLKQAPTKDALKKQGHALGRTESDYLFSQRLALAGTFAEQMAAIKSTSIDLTKIDECHASLGDIAKRPPNGAPSLLFRLCYRAAWAKIQSAVDDAMKAATAYDQLADAGNTSTGMNAYDNITDKHYDDVVNSATESAADFWTSINQLIAFAGAVSNATSGTNLANLKKAIDSLK